MRTLIWFALQRCTEGMLPYVDVHPNLYRWTASGGRGFMGIEVVFEVPPSVKDCDQNSPWSKRYLEEKRQRWEERRQRWTGESQPMDNAVAHLSDVVTQTVEAIAQALKDTNKYT